MARVDHVLARTGRQKTSVIFDEETLKKIKASYEPFLNRDMVAPDIDDPKKPPTRGKLVALKIEGGALIATVETK